MIFMAVATGANIGCSVIISQLFGAKDYSRMKTAVSTSLISCLALSLILTLSLIHIFQRLIGRSLRSVLDLEALNEFTITIDCDVVQADGGTRTASITGGFVALGLAVKRLIREGKLEKNPIKTYLACLLYTSRCV